ncbi:MAG: sigma-70 family RNA polymerase sigma factor [Longimicrobiales bacterium]|nr:sigma-70 family RNA polymerase sigma factor [Longimicrobiales bacterium]
MSSGSGTAVEPEALFSRHHEPLHRYLARLTGDPELAADAAQEAFVRLLEQRPPPERPRPWLYRVATNIVRDDARAAKRHRVLGMDGKARGAHGDPPGSPARVVDRETARRKMRTALEALSEKERQALLMREEGFKHREIAEALGTTTGSIGTLLRRAIEKAAERLRTEEEA